MTTHVTKSWMEDGKLVVQVIPQEQIYKREWVGLTENEKADVLIGSDGRIMDYDDVVDAVEAKLKEKNSA